MSDYLFSLIEKYSLAILQFLTTLYISRYFGIESLGMIAAFSLIVAVATVLSEAGSSYIIMGSTTDLAENISQSLTVSVGVSVVLYFVIYFLSPLYLSQIATTNHYVLALQGYALMILVNPIQLITYSGLIKLERTRSLVMINFISWFLSFLILYLLSVIEDRSNEVVVVYFVVLAFLRSALALIVLSRSMGLGKPLFSKFSFKYRMSLVASQIIHTISSNIWTYLIAMIVSIEANAILAVFSKVRDLISGNLSHAIHRIVYSKLPGLELKTLKNFRLLWLRRFALLNSTLLLFLYLGRKTILELFNVPWNPDLDIFILFPLCVGLLYPLTDFMKSLIRFDNQQTALLFDSLVLISIIILLVIGSSFATTMIFYLLSMLLGGIYILKRVA